MTTSVQSIAHVAEDAVFWYSGVPHHFSGLVVNCLIFRILRAEVRLYGLHVLLTALLIIFICGEA
jgi:hypothetical protein